MQPDQCFVLGLAVAALSIPALLAAISDSRVPRLAIVLLILGGGLVGYAAYENPGSYSLAGTPGLVVDVIGRFFN